MAKKKGKNKQSNTPAEPRPTEQIMQDLSRLLSQQQFDSVDDMNQFLQELVSSGQPIPSSPAGEQSDLDRAQELVYQAYETNSKTKILQLARQALEISPDCADAYVLLAEYNTKVAAEALAFYEAGMRAGERALGDEFEEMKGHFWGVIETRPYMRARMGVAMLLQNLGRLEEAAQHMGEMLALNPNDNQGVRELYRNVLFELGDDKKLQKLFATYEADYSASAYYGRALFEFRKKGKTKKADDHLREAIDYNPYIPPYLLGKKKLPKTNNAAYYSPGDETEALEYVLDGVSGWMQTKGALQWLEKIYQEYIAE